MKSVKDAISILNEESELWLNYLDGQQTGKLPSKKITDHKHYNTFIRIFAYVRYIFRLISFSKKTDDSCENNFLFFSSSLNQQRAIDEIFTHLVRLNKKTICITTVNRLREKQITRVTFSISDALKALYLLIFRGPKLYRTLSKHPVLSPNRHFNLFIASHIYLIYFLRVLPKINPKMVLISNDHNVPNRCLIAVSRYLGVRTAYVQHASVSEFFPALTVDYAFLDGQHSFDIYKTCVNNISPYLKREFSTEVYLTGQQKKLKFSKSRRQKSIGIAINKLDNLDSYISLIIFLTRSGLSLIVRWHPNQSKSDVKKILELGENNSCVKLSDPYQDNISDYLEKVSIIVAGDSGIHLEAALSGVYPVYYNESFDSKIKDYYGFVKSGLAYAVSDQKELLTLINGIRNLKINKNSIQYYSDTFGTPLEGRESELVAKLICKLTRYGFEDDIVVRNLASRKIVIAESLSNE
ncbi:hypothetical protein SAMN04488070_1136 [Pseudidiomarina maritima]|uniref:Surface carbohydrate biosynthesis protein n=1 Tax=Pseudidiomarina maritima TaxID=519453 RepID=A0A1I6GRU9_9GAMM|nr:hypothetical protein [Pseudidiomarina maritima]SFR44922.1 hypothetical protein SAMN04488070_1136 [Pseudidiomarina maritima]